MGLTCSKPTSAVAQQAQIMPQSELRAKVKVRPTNFMADRAKKYGRVYSTEHFIDMRSVSKVQQNFPSAIARKTDSAGDSSIASSLTN